MNNEQKNNNYIMHSSNFDEKEDLISSFPDTIKLRRIIAASIDDDYDEDGNIETIESGEESKAVGEGPSFKEVYDTKLNSNSEPFENIVGHDNQKKEVLTVIDWFNRSEDLRKKGITIPKGILLFGDPGNGKTLFIKEIIKFCGCPVFVFQGEQTNVVKGIIETFQKAKEVGHSIVVFDELDLLINKESRVTRALQECLDGVEENDDILVLAATNSIHRIPDALQRNGRLEKLIEIPYPTGEEAMELFKKHLNEFNVSLPLDFDEEGTSDYLKGVSCAGVKTIVNDLVLRNGFENITSDMIDQSIYNITDRVKSRRRKVNITVAIHEASHAVMAYSYQKFFKINNINLNGRGGDFRASEVEQGYWPYNKCIANIKISLAGLIAEKVIFGNGSRGCELDLQDARKTAYNMFNIIGYSSCWETLPLVDCESRTETQIKRRKMERRIERLLRKCEKETIRYVKKHKTEILRLGNLLYEKKHLKFKEIIACINNSNDFLKEIDTYQCKNKESVALAR